MHDFFSLFLLISNKGVALFRPDASSVYHGKKGQSVADWGAVNVYYSVFHIPCWVKESRLRNLSDSLRSNSLLPVTSVEQ